VSRGELVKLLYRLGIQSASGMLSLTPSGNRAELFVLRRGHVVVPPGELARRTLIARLARLAAIASIGSPDARSNAERCGESINQVTAVFEGGVAAYPPGAQHLVSLAAWARQHLEQQLDGTLAERLIRELAGIRLSLRSELAPEPVDEADRRIIAVMGQPRRLDQIWPLARTPRFRMLAFLYFLRGVDALELEGIVAERSAPTRTIDPRRSAALRTLGVSETADLETIKRAYRRLARAIHPDLQPLADVEQRRGLERRFAEITAAYQAAL
jgi:DnaJ-domain-containing protein 1